MGALSLPAQGIICLDASAIIYSVERHPLYRPLMAPVWSAADAGEIQLFSSALTLLECLVGPMKAGNTDLVRVYDEVLARSVHLVPVSAAVLRQAARLRASHGLKTPDAIHAATAIHSGCSLFITNDRVFRRVPGLNVAVLADVAAEAGA